MFEEPREAVSKALASLKHSSKETFQQGRLFHGSSLSNMTTEEKKNEDVGNSEKVKMKKLIFWTYNETFAIRD